MIVNFDYKNNKAKISTDDPDDFELIRKFFSRENKGATFGRRRKNPKSRFVVRDYVITAAGYFKIGLFREISKYLLTLQMPVQITATKEFKQRMLTGYDFEEIHQLNLPLYDYQTEAIIKCLKSGCGVIEIGTGGGKTLTIATLINTIEHNVPQHQTAIIVPTLQLVNQTYSDFIEYGLDENKLAKFSGDGIVGDMTKASIIICNIQILSSKKQDIAWIQNVDLLVCDEVHIAKKGNKICNLIESVYTPHKFGCTGSLPESKIDEWNVYGIFGPHLYRKPPDELIKEGYLSNLDIYILRLIHNKFPPYHLIDDLPKVEKRKLPPQAKLEMEYEFIHNDEWRNTTIRKLCNKMDGNVLVMVDRIEHGEALLKHIQEKTNKDVYFIQGDVAVNVRDEIKNLMETKSNIIAIAIAKIFSTGINIKNLPCVIFAMAGKAKTKLIQSIGRGLRLHKDKVKLIIFDICDNLYYSQDHLKDRIKLYKEYKYDFIIKEVHEK